MSDAEAINAINQISNNILSDASDNFEGTVEHIDIDLERCKFLIERINAILEEFGMPAETTIKTLKNLVDSETDDTTEWIKKATMFQEYLNLKAQVVRPQTPMSMRNLRRLP